MEDNDGAGLIKLSPDPGLSPVWLPNHRSSGVKTSGRIAADENELQRLTVRQFLVERIVNRCALLERNGPFLIHPQRLAPRRLRLQLCQSSRPESPPLGKSKCQAAGQLGDSVVLLSAPEQKSVYHFTRSLLLYTL